MKKNTIFLKVWAAILLFCSSSIIVVGQEYDPLTSEEIAQYKKLETPELYVGNIAKYLYTPSGKIKRETNFDNRNDEGLRFEIAENYEYDELDSLIGYTFYSEFKIDKHEGKLRDYTYKYNYRNTDFTSIGKLGQQVDTEYFILQNDDDEKLICETRVAFRLYKGETDLHLYECNLYEYNDANLVNKKTNISRHKIDNIQYYTYDSDGNLIEKQETNYDSSYEKNTIYEYDKFGNLVKERMVSSRNEGEESGYEYKYNSENKEIEKLKFENNQLTYTYLSEYDENGNLIRFIQSSPKETTSVWVFFYNEKNQQTAFVSLYNRE